MKTNKYNWLLIGAVALAMGACSQEDDLLSDNNEMTKEGKKLYTFEATIEADTRTTFNDDYTGLVWGEADYFLLFDDSYNGVGCSSVENNKYTAELPADATKVYAFYPDEVVKSYNENGMFTANIPYKQRQQKAGELNGENLPMYAQADLSSDYIKLAFRPLASLVAFNIYDSTGGNGEKIGCVSFSSDESVVMNGETGIDVATGQQGSMSGKSSGMVMLDVTSEIPQTKPTDKAGYIYMAVNPIVYSNNRFVVYTDKYSYTFTANKEIDLTNPYNVQTVTLNLANAEKKELDDLNNCFEDANFLNYLLENFDLNKDGRLSSFEANRVESIYCYSMSITSLKGIELFTKLWSLYCQDNQLTSLDVSKNVNLKYLSCDSNQLTSLDVSKNVNLETLGCYSNQHTSLDVSTCTGLTYLSCESNQLTSLDVSDCNNLVYLYCAYNQLTSLNVNNCVNLEDLYCYSNQLASLDINDCKSLMTLYCYSNQLTNLDVNNCANLKYLHCNSNQLTSLDVSKNL